MTSAYDVYQKDGVFRRTGNVALDTESDESTTEVIAATSGKRIVPAWAFISFIGSGAAIVEWSLHGASAAETDYIIHRVHTSEQYHDKRMFTFGGQELMTLSDNQALQFTFHDSTGLELTDGTAHISVGYYLVNA